MNRPSKPNISAVRDRAHLLRRLRDFFDDRGFLEVQPPCLSRDCVIDAYIDPVEVGSTQFDLNLSLPPLFYLQTSPEAAMKRLLAAGSPSIYSIGPVFRAGELGDQHNLEFTMLEWYEVEADMESGIELLGTLATSMLGSDRYDVITYRELFSNNLGFDPIDASLAELHRRVEPIDDSLATTLADDRDGMLDVLLSQQLQSSLGVGRPLIVKDYPLSQAALAKASKDDPQCAARFELFYRGIELANGYDELRDANILLERFHQSNKMRVRSGRPTLATESYLMDAMRSGLPPCAGVAMGVDRLLMAITGANSIREVIPFPIEIA